MTAPKKGRNAWAISLVAMGLTVMLYTLIFSFYRIGDYLVALALALLVGRVAYIMASGLDTSKHPKQEPLPKTGDEAVDGLIQKGQEMLTLIRQENDMIPDETLSAQMDELESVTNRIFKTVIEQPSKAPQIRRFMEYYLPTTLKMLSGYRRMDERKVTGENSNKTKQQVARSMDIILKAFNKQLDTMFQDDMLDISTDIDVLETMLKQDGLIDSGLHGDAGAQAQAAAATAETAAATAEAFMKDKQ